jgi:hypothetical protein
MFLGPKEVPKLKLITIESMNMSKLDLPKEALEIKGVDDITISRIICRRIAVPEKSQLKRVETFTLENFVLPVPSF